MSLFGADLRKHIAHGSSQDINELIEKRFVETKGPPITHRPPQNPAKHIIPIGITGLNPVGNRKTQSADMVCNHAKCDIVLISPIGRMSLIGRIRSWQRARIFSTTHRFEFVKNRTENIGLVV